MKHFAIDDEHSYVQFSLTMAEDTYNALTGEGAAAGMQEVG